MKKPITDASAEELREYAQTHHGLDIHHNMKAETIVSRLRAVGFSGDEIDVDEPAVTTAREPVAAQDAASGDPWKQMVKILIPQDTDGKGEPVFVSVNDRHARIKRGEPVLVPLPFVESLRNAEEFVYDRDDNGMINGEPRKVPAVPFQVVG